MAPYLGSTGQLTPPVVDGEVPDVSKEQTIPLPKSLSQTATTNGHSSVQSGAKTSAHDFSHHAIPMNAQYAYTARKIRVCTIGAGFSGLLMAHKFQHRFSELQEIIDHKIFEARADIGGTWFVNTYPGVQCDVPAHVYAFPFDPNPDWTRFFSSGAEIQAYIKRTAKKWDLERDVYLNTRVVAATWQEDSGVWKVTVEHEGQQRDEYCEILISGQGVLVNPSWPKVPGLSDFKGHVTHSADWDHNYDYSNKRIAVIGNGSSGIQIVPQMAKLPGNTVKNFARGPAWVYYRVPPSKHLGREVDDVNPTYFEEEKERYRNPEQHKDYRKSIISRTNKAFRLFIKGEQNTEVMRLAADQMAEKLNHDPVLCEQLIPKWELGCRRVTPGPGYLESFTQPNCSLTTSPITKVTETGVLTADGQEFECDVVICATGFDVSHRPQYPLIGQKGVNLRERWADEPESYLSIATNDFPNYFMMMGPNCLGGHGSLVESLNWTGDYFVKMIKKIATEDIKYVVPKASAVDSFVKYGDEIHKTLVWTGSCSSWYKRGRVNGRVTALFAGGAVLFHRLISEIRGEDYDIVYNSSNPFKFMGNGFTEWEMQDGVDLAWYVEAAEPDPSTKKTRRMMDDCALGC